MIGLWPSIDSDTAMPHTGLELASSCAARIVVHAGAVVAQSARHVIFRMSWRRAVNPLAEGSGDGVTACVGRLKARHRDRSRVSTVVSVRAVLGKLRRQDGRA